MMLPDATLRHAERLRALLAAGALPATDPTLGVAVRLALVDLDRATEASRRRTPEPDRRRLLTQDIERLWTAVATGGPVP